MKLSFLSEYYKKEKLLKLKK